MSRSRARSTARSTTWSALLLVTALACSKKAEQPASEEDGKQEQEKDQVAAVEPELAEAMAAAASESAAAQKPTGDAAGGPPPRGIFPPGGADAQIAPGKPPQITVGSTGTEPRLSFTGGFGTKASPLKSRVTVVLQGGPGQGGLPVEFDLDFEQTTSAAAPKSPDAPKNDAPKSPDAPKNEVRGRVVAAAIPRGMTRVPPELSGGIDKLRGSEVRFELWPNGGATALRTEVKPGAPPELSDVVRALGDAIATVVLPYPDEAIGAGGYWMVTSRDGLMDLDLVTYRLIRVESIADGVATLQVSAKRYAAGTEFAMAGVDGRFTLEELQSGGEGSLRYRPGTSLPVRGKVQVTLGALLIPEGMQAVDGQPAQRGRLEMVSQAGFSER